MKSAYFRELQRYSKQDVANAFQIDLNTVVRLLRRLKSYGAVKVIANHIEKTLHTEYSPKNEIISDVDILLSNQQFVFTFVGVITIENFVFLCYPKYVNDNTNLHQKFKQVLQVIKKYNTKSHIISMSNGIEEQSPFNMLAIILFIFYDYYENGLYSNQNSTLELNGDGEINWDKTIDESFAFLVNNRPIYTDLFVNSTVDDLDSIIRRIHQVVLSTCSKLLLDSGLCDLFDIEYIVLTEEELDDIGDEEYLLYQLSKELNVQFVTRKQILLKTLFAFVSQHSTLAQGFGLSMYGTNNFHTVWEEVCANVFGSHLYCKLKDLPLSLNPQYIPLAENSLIDLIEKPIWTAFVNGKHHSHTAADTLIPDLITIFPFSGSPCFGIFDAKYYNISLCETGISGQPGIGDITKQYLYQKAYSDFLIDHKIYQQVNAFLFPDDSSDFTIIGEVKLDILANMNLCNIQAWKLPATFMYEWFLDNIVIDIAQFLKD